MLWEVDLMGLRRLMVDAMAVRDDGRHDLDVLRQPSYALAIACRKTVSRPQSREYVSHIRAKIRICCITHPAS